MKMRKILLGLILLAAGAAPVEAANVKLSQIASGSGVNTSTDQCVAVRSGATDVLVTLAASAGTDTTSASNISSGTLAAARGGAGTITGALKGNGAGVVTQAACADLSNGAASCSTDTTVATNISSGTLATARLPSPFTSGTISGNTSTFGTTSGTLTNGHCVSIDGSGNLVDAGGACTTGGGGGTVSSGTSGQLTYYASSGTTVSGNANATISSGALTLGQATSVLGQLKLSGSTSGTTTLTPAVAASGTLTLPAATDTLVGKATTDTLTNKTYDTAGTGNSFSINGVAATANTGTGSVVRATSPALVTPALGTPASGVMTNVTGTATGLTAGVTNALKSASTTVDVSAATAPSSGQVLTATDTTHATWQAASGGGLTIGNAISGGTNNRILFEDGSGNLAVSSGGPTLRFDNSTGLFLLAGQASFQSGSDVALKIQTNDTTDMFQTIGDNGSNQLFAIDQGSHLYTNAVAGENIPTIAAGTGAGTSPTISITGTDVNGTVSVTAGVTPSTSAAVATITFSKNFAAAPKTILLIPANSATALLSGATMVYVDTANTTASVWKITSGTAALTATIAYKWYYYVMG